MFTAAITSSIWFNALIFAPYFLLHSQHNTLTSSPFFTPVLHGAEEACRREGIALSLIVVGPAEPVLEQIRLHQPDAILCAGFFEPEVLSALQQTGKGVAREEAQVRGAPIRFEADGSGFRFVVFRDREWRPITDDRDLRPRPWASAPSSSRFRRCSA